ncbi:monooxygenase [Candidimonas nitroreducens]|uniref:Monooxygenase n=2 Tax=Candidimonas nitroreducens TaxID=683354 RepID=A0A225MKD1_9BURK|nr:monooxygenase [Candidimonas nitroreducens]
MEKKAEHVVIVGAGLGGLTAALALLRQGFRVTVLEQAPALGEVGAGVQLSANATRVLSLIGLDEVVAASGAQPTDKEIRLWSTGQTWQLFDLGAASVQRYGHTYAMFHRADLHKALENALRSLAPGAIRLNCRCESVDLSGPRPSVLLSNGERVAGDLIVGADGVHSRVRRAIVGADQPVFSGMHAWRGVIPTNRLPGHLRKPAGVNWVGPGRHVIHYPLRRCELTNFVGIVEGSNWEVESWTQQGSLDACLGDFKGWHEDVQTMIRAVDVHFKWALMVREPIERWSSGCVTLLGDAAHPTLPFLAQGAAMALEDGYVLARALAAHSGDVPAALSAYESARVERTAKVVRGSNGNAARFHNPKLANAQGAAQYIEDQWAPDKVRERYEWLFEYKVDEVPV